jgi:hypothetical protein
VKKYQPELLWFVPWQLKPSAKHTIFWQLGALWLGNCSAMTLINNERVHYNYRNVMKTSMENQNIYFWTNLVSVFFPLFMKWMFMKYCCDWSLL